MDGQDDDMEGYVESGANGVRADSVAFRQLQDTKADVPRLIGCIDRANGKCGETKCETGDDAIPDEIRAS